MHSVLIVLIKDLLMRRNYWIQTSLEIILPVATIILLNLTPFPQPDPPYNEYTNDTIYKSCNWNAVDLFMEVLYEPSNSFTNALMSNVKCLGGFQDVKAGKIHESDSSFKVGVIFKGTNSTSILIPDNLEYELYPTTNHWNNAPELWWDPSTLRKSYTSGPLKKLLRLIHAIDESFIQMKSISTPKINFRNMDLISGSPRIHTIVVMAAFFLGFSLMVPGVVGRLVQEKLTGAKELVLIMGLKKWHLWVSKLLDCIIVFGIVQLFIVIFLYIPLTGSSQVLSVVPPVVTWAYLVYALLGVIVFLFFLSCFFTNPTLAVFITQVVWGISFVLFSVISFYSSKISRIWWIICFLLPHFAFFTGLSILLDFDYYGKSVKLGEVLSGELSYPSLYNVLVMMAVDIVLYSLLTWYLEQVNPGKFGIQKPYDFCFKKSYWFPNKLKSGIKNSILKNEMQNVDFEFVPDGMRVGVSVINLSKEYKSLSKSSVMAVDNISIDFYSGEISALLGHNGAGKTTVFSVISGLTHATSGKIIIDGHDIAENTDEARKSLGLCPQQDMLFQDLDSHQILCFFGMIKGLTLSEASREANEFIRKLKLNDVKEVRASKLSGGQKRKISLAIALIGGSKVVLLDEPTSGLDPEIRREIWEILLEFRGSRTILLTTHFMEEADALSDRIAIMDHGRIKCYGTPMYLKSKYGSGYTLSVVIKNTENAEKMTTFICNFVKTAKLKRRNVLTLTYQLPEEEVAHFPPLLAGLNTMQDSREIQSYSMAFSTFEDVFIRLRGPECEDDVCIDVVDHSPYKRLTCSDEVHTVKINYLLLPFYQFNALIIKKFIYFYRNFRSYFVFSIIPLLFVITSFIILPAIVNKIPEKMGHNEGNLQGVFTYSLELYNNSVVLYSVSSENKVSESFVKYISEHGSKTRRVKNVDKELQNIFQDNFYAYMRETIMGIEFGQEEVNILHNSHAVHMLPVSLNSLYSSILLANNVPGAIKTTVNLKYSDRENKELLTFIGNTQDPLTSCFLSDIPDYIGIQVLFYLIGPIREKYFGAKHLQLMTTSTALYWFSHLIFDFATFLTYLLVSGLIIGVSNQDDMFIQNEGEILLGLVLWGIGLILLTYALSTFMTNLGAASAIFLTFYCICTFLVYNLVRWDIWPKGILYIHPSCILKMGLNNICLKEEDNYKTALIIYNIILFAFLVLKDCHILSYVIHRSLSRVLYIDYEDIAEKNAEVKDHEELVKKIRNTKDFSTNSLIVDDLKRWYFNRFRRRPAVKGISFAVKQGECFGLLGVNGAGKTTSFKMMTGAIAASHGQVFINGYNLFSPIEKSRGLFQIGYCPQYGGFIPTFKGKELLALFARLRGLTGSHVTRETVKWTEELDLKEHGDTPVESYSGGNQRKLLVGIALIGDSPVVFLDEPTSGVDPVTRRILWKAINNLRAEGKSVLLTSHSMDECEAICTKLAIMVKGSFRCYGEITTLKDTFGQGYTVQLKISSDATPEEFRNIKEVMSNEFDPGCDLIDEHLTILEYHIKNRIIKWDALFLKLISIKENFDKLESFNASATTLEQIFISFARNQ